MTYDVDLAGVRYTVQVENNVDGHTFRILLNGEPIEADAQLLQPGVLSLLIGKKSYRVLLDERYEQRAVVIGERRLPYRIEDPRSFRAHKNTAAGTDGPRSVHAPMPGRVVRVLVKVGDSVEAHQGIVVIEAMKMQNELKAPKAGRVTRIAAEPGSTVQPGDVLAVIE